VTEQHKLLETFSLFREALLTNDTRVLESLIADDYTGYDPLGNPQDKKMSVDAYRPGCAKLDRYEVTDVETRMMGEVGVITGKGYLHGEFAGEEFEHKLRFLDLYVYRGGRWQLYLSQLTTIEAV
jgi:hypothetical protein